MKRFFVATVVFVLLAHTCVSAQVWTDADIISSDIIADGGFEGSSGTVYGAVVDPVTFAGSEHKNVARTDGGYFAVTDRPGGSLSSFVTNGDRVRVRFDYRAADENVYLRCELRGIAPAEIIYENQNPYWDGFAFNRASPVPTGSWAKFEAVFDTGLLKAHYSADGQSLTPGSAYFFISAGLADNTRKTLYIDNLSVKSETVPDLIVPLQKPAVSIGGSFSADASMPDHSGKTGGVYKGRVDVSASAAATLAVSVSNYRFNAGTYKLALWFMEAQENSDTMTRMWRPVVGTNSQSGLITSAAGAYFYYTEQANATPRGKWKRVEMDFKVDASTNANLLNQNAVISLFWQCAANEYYAAKNMTGDFYVYISDFKLFKYPVNSTAFLGSLPDDGADAAPNDSFVTLHFSMPIDADAIDYGRIIINGAPQSPDSVLAEADGGVLRIGKKGGFAPGASYTVSVEALTDIFERQTKGVYTKRFHVRDYLDVEWLGWDKTGGNLARVSVKNKSGSALGVVLALVFYRDNHVEKVSLSGVLQIADGHTVEAPIPNAQTDSSRRVKLCVWDAAGLSPLSEELVVQ